MRKTRLNASNTNSPKATVTCPQPTVLVFSNKEIFDSIQSLRDEFHQLRACIKSLDSRMSSIEASLATLREAQDKSDNEIKKMKKAINDLKVSESTNSSDILEEMEQREQRRENIMIFGLSERDDGSLLERRRHDEEALKQLVQAVGLPEVRISETRRVGRTGSGKSRPLKVKLKDSSIKPVLLRKAKQLKNHPTFKHVFISMDLTKRQQEQRSRLRKELKERREQGEDVVIYNGQIRERDSLSNFQI